jgi:predicted aspartyl protease
VKVTPFDGTRDLIIVEARVWGRWGDTALLLALDTGSSETVIAPYVVDDLGYSPRDGDAMTTVRAAVGKEHGYTLRVSKFAALGFAVPDFRVHVFDLAAGYGIDGLVGLSFLRRFNYEVRSAEGRLLVEEIARGSAGA